MLSGHGDDDGCEDVVGVDAGDDCADADADAVKRPGLHCADDLRDEAGEALSLPVAVDAGLPGVALPSFSSALRLAFCARLFVAAVSLRKTRSNSSL